MPGIHQFFVIGIDDYTHDRFSQLSNAKGDAERVRKVLSERYGFVEALPPLYNSDATRSAIDDTLSRLYSAVNEQDSLLIYFAGHGEMNRVNNKGYWVPHDGTDQQSSWIKNSTILDLIEDIKCKHILLISDSCFSGSLLGSSRSAEIIDNEDLDSRASRWIITSGRLQTVLDGVKGKGSPFSKSLCEVLETNRLSSVSVSQLFTEVFRLTEAKRQTPEKGFMLIDDHKGGQMIFRLLQITATDEASVLEEKPEFPLPFTVEPEAQITRSITSHEPQNPPEAWFFEPTIGQVKLHDIIQNTYRIIILGGAGSGKSNELKTLALRLQKNDTIYVPILKRFNTYTDENIEDFLPEGWGNVYFPSLVLLLDGLDEIQPQYFATAVRKLTAFAERYQQIRIIVTCRTNFYELPDKDFGGTLNGFSVYNLNDLNLSDINTYANLVLDQDSSAFLNVISQSGLKDLVQKPFFLQVIIKYFQTNTISGSNRSAIIRDALNEYLLNNKRHYYSTGIQISQHWLLAALERIAFVMELTGKNFISDVDLHEVFKDITEYNYCKFVPAFQFDEANAQWMFDHNNIQEYLASRVLTRQPFDKLINILSIKSAGQSKVKPTWINTLSFLINTEDSEIIDNLLDWIIENDREVIVRFEPDRVSDDKRKELFIQIFEFYSARQIWLHSNKFSHKELARFGQSLTTLNFLIEKLQSELVTRIDKINALHVLLHFDISHFQNSADALRSLLISLLQYREFGPSDIFTVIGVIVELGFTDRFIIDLVLQIFGSRKNQYLRAGIYKLLVASDYIDDYVEELLAGVEYSSFGYTDIDRESFSLMDETFWLRVALEKITRPDALEKLFEKITRGVSRLMFISDYNEILDKVLKHAFDVYLSYSKIFDSIALFFAKEASDNSKKHIPLILNFFEKNNLKIAAFEFILSDKRLSEYEKYESTTLMIDSDIITWLISYFNEHKITGEEIERIYQNFIWRRRNHENYQILLPEFEYAFNTQTELLLVRPEIKDWVEINRKKAQRSFDLLFDEVALKAEIKKLVDIMDADPISIDDLYPTTNFTGEDIEDSFASSAVGLIREFTYRGSFITKEALWAWIRTGDNFLNYRIQSIHDRIVNQAEITISEEQTEFIRKWAENKGNNRSILWHFIQRFDLKLPEDKLLNFTLYFDSSAESEVDKSGTIEKLEEYVTRKKVKEKVAQNIANGIDNTLVWTSNAGYALRRRIKASYEHILNYLEVAHEQEYRFDQLLKLWFSQTNNINRLKKFINSTVSNDLRSDGIGLLWDTGKEKDFLIEYFTNTINSGEKTLVEKLEAANYLVGLDVTTGFDFIVQHVTSKQDPSFDYRRFLSNFKFVTNVTRIDPIIQLLTISKQDNFKLDVFNDLESILLEGLTSIGIQSDANFIAVKTSLEEYIVNKQGVVKHVNFLHFNIEKIQEQFNLKKTEKISTKIAVELYDSL